MSVASECVNILLANKAKYDRASSLEIAIGLVGVGRFDDAVGQLRKAAFEESDPYAMWFYLFPPLRHLHRHRGFKALLKELNLPLQRLR